MKPFIPDATVNLAVTTTTGNVSLAAHTFGPQVRVYNAGPGVAFIAFGTSSVSATTGASLPIPPGVIEMFTIPINATHMAGIAAAATGSTATVYATPGTGE